MDSFKDRFPNIPERISGLDELACNLWWSWHPEARMLFKQITCAAWKLKETSSLRGKKCSQSQNL